MLQSSNWHTDTYIIGTWTVYLHNMFELNLISASGTNCFEKHLQVRSYTEAWSFRRLCQRSQSTCRLTWKAPTPVEKGNYNFYISKFYKYISLIRHKTDYIVMVFCMYLGPGGGTLPALSSSIISSMSLGVRSSWKPDKRRIIYHK